MTHWLHRVSLSAVRRVAAPGRHSAAPSLGLRTAVAPLIGLLTGALLVACGGSSTPYRPANAPSVSPVLAPAPGASTASPSASGIPAPMRLHAEPNVYGLVRLPGDFVEFQYSVGFLDRAARLQFKLEAAMRSVRRGAGSNTPLVTVYVLSRDDWERSGLPDPYGTPVRVGRTAIATPAQGDDDTLRLWSGLGVSLPSAGASPLRGTPQQASALGLADVLTELQMAEIAVDAAGLGGDTHWVRGLVVHTALRDLLLRQEPETLRDLELVWRGVGAKRASKAFGAADYGPSIDYLDWLWFQAQFARGAETLFASEGNDAWRSLRKLRKKSGGVITGEYLLERYPNLRAWYDDTFSAFSMLRAG